MNFSPRETSSLGASLLLGFLAIAVFFFGFGIWSTTAQIAGAVVTSGKVEVEQNRQVVQHPEGGVVASIFVTEGQLVAAHEVLMRLDVSAEEVALGFAQEQVFGIKVRQERLSAEASGRDSLAFSTVLTSQTKQNDGWPELLAGQEQLFEANMLSLKSQIRQLRQEQDQISAQIDGISAQLAAVEVQLTLAALALVDQEDLLRKGLAPSAAVLALQREKSALEGEKGALRASIAEARARFAAATGRIMHLREARRGDAIAKLRDLEASLRDLLHRVQHLESQIAAADIRAPTSGIVYQLGVHTPRAVVQAAEPLMYLIPQDRPRVIAANVQPQHIDQVHVGQQVKMRLSALNARTTPEVFGRVTVVSADAIEDEMRGGFHYRIEVRLDAGALGALPDGAVLLPGMPVETFILTGDRSPLAYLVKPISDYLARAFRES